MPIEKILPWQKIIWDSMIARKKQNRFPHALLFCGMDGSGKKEFAECLANYLLCSEPLENDACGQCRACRLQQAKSHPDFLNITPEEDAQFIKIDQIRDAVSLVNGTSLLNGSRVILIHPATAMNMNAANALLKTLEEPTPDTYFILITNQGLRLPATISSRCQKVIFSKPDHTLVYDKETSELRCNLYDGLIQLEAKQADPVEFAEKWGDNDVKILLQLLLSWMRDVLRYKLTESEEAVINSDYQKEIKQFALKFTQENIINYSDRIQKMYGWVLNAMNMSRPLLLKEIFIRWVKVC